MTLVTNKSFKNNLFSQVMKKIHREFWNSFSTMSTGEIGDKLKCRQSPLEPRDLGKK